VTGYVVRIDSGRTDAGPGRRSVVVLKGCPLRCLWCDTPETWNVQPELLHNPAACTHCLACIDHCGTHALSAADGQLVVDSHVCRWCGDCADACSSGARVQAGAVMTESRVFERVEADRAAAASGWDGVTLSGGEPLLQPEFVSRLLRGCRDRRLPTMLDTGGFADGDVLHRLAPLADAVRIGVKLLDTERHQRLTGFSSRPILDNLSWLACHHPTVRVRLLLIPGVNDSREDLAAIGAHVAALGVRVVDVVPYRPSPLASFQTATGPVTRTVFATPTSAQVELAMTVLGAHGLSPVCVGR
jgi:pyruvate formate lyase activating enzyme